VNKPQVVGSTPTLGSKIIMKRGFENRNLNKEEIVGARIPDEDMNGWITTLREAGFTDQEMDDILGHLNKTYSEMRGIKEKRVEQILKETLDYMYKTYGRVLGNDEIKHLRNSISQRPEFEA